MPLIAQINWIGTGSGETRSLGALANVNYKFKDRYMIQTILRADAHSAFGINNRWGLFRDCRWMEILQRALHAAVPVPG